MTEIETPRGLRILQRVVLPLQGNLDVVPLYVETNMDRGANLTPVDTERRSGNDDQQQTTAVASATPGEVESAVRFGTQATSTGDLAARRTARITAGRRVSFGSYFNAFPASYWRRWTVVEDILLRVRVEGECTIIVYRSTAKGASHPVESIVVDSDEPETVEIKLPLSQFIDGGWYWFDIAAASRGVTLIEADWATRTDRLDHGRFSIAMTTFNRPDYCLDNLRVLAEAPDVLDVLDHVYVVDQGTNHVEAHDDFTDATRRSARSCA